MYKKHCLLSFKLLCAFFSVQTFAQTNNPLINSGEKISQGNSYYEKKQYKDAIKYYGEVNKSDTNYMLALFEMANAYYNDSQFVKSLEAARLGMNLFPDKFSSFSMQIANALDNMKMPKEAQDEYDAAIARNPHNYLLYYNKGITNYNIKAYDDAKKNFQQALLINPFYAPAHFFLGSVYLQEGNLVPAIMAYNCCLLISPDGKYKNQAINLLTSISKGTDDIQNYVKSRNPAKAEKSFNSAQEILLSKVAYDSKYKTKVDIDDPLIKQIQVVIEKLVYSKNDQGFAMQYYVPFFVKVFSENDFQPLIYTMFSDVEIKEIQSWNKKNKKDANEFTGKAYVYFNDIRSGRILDFESRAKNTSNYIYNDNALIAKGEYVIINKKSVPKGKWEFYNTEGGKSADGSFNEEGMKEGLWTTYYENGVVKSKVYFKNGKNDGSSMGWFSNGNKWYEETYKSDLLEGKQTIYFFNENLKNIFNFKADKKEGEQQYYNNKNELTGSYMYKNDKLDGVAKTYYENKKLKTETAYINDVENGNFKSYFETGELYAVGQIKDGKREGLWTNYYTNGKVSAKTTYIANEVTGEYTEYYKNGKVSSTGNYVKKKLDGKTINYDDDGIMYSTSEYDRSKLREITFYDKKGNVISTTTTRKGAANIVFYSANGLKTAEGYFDKEGNKQGKYIKYYGTGPVSEESNWKDGEMNGGSKSFYPNGKLSKETNYKNGVEDGYFKSYFVTGQLNKEGWVVNGNKQQTWISYNVSGDVYKKEYYLDDELDGYVQYFYPGNIPDYEFIYHKGWHEGTIQYDSTGKIIQQNKFIAGKGTLTFRHFNQKVLSEVPYNHYMSNGPKKSYFFDGTVSSTSTLLNDEYDGKMINYLYGGKLKSEGNYVSGKKDGEWKYYYSNGQVSTEEKYKNGELEGLYKTYSNNGKPAKTITYVEGEIEGPYTYYGENGEVALVLNFEDGAVTSYQYMGKDGKLVEPIKLKSYSGKINAFYANGKPSASFDYVENNINGKYTFYFSNGNMKSEGIMLNGYMHGLCKQYFSDGKIYKEENYRLGNLHGKVMTYYPDGSPESECYYYDDEINGKNKYYDSKGKVTIRDYYHGFILSVK